MEKMSHNGVITAIFLSHKFMIFGSTDKILLLKYPGKFRNGFRWHLVFISSHLNEKIRWKTQFLRSGDAFCKMCFCPIKEVKFSPY